MSEPTKIKHLNAMANYLPKGRLFNAAFIEGSNLRNVLCGFAYTLEEAQNFILELEAEYNPATTTRFLDEFETLLGLPDLCLGRATTDEERRRDILLKLASNGVQTIADFERLGEIFGIDMKISTGADHSGFCANFPVLFFGNESDARYTIVVRLPPEQSDGFCLEFCYPYSSVTQNALKCMIEQSKPANTQIVYVDCE